MTASNRCGDMPAMRRRTVAVDCGAALVLLFRTSLKVVLWCGSTIIHMARPTIKKDREDVMRKALLLGLMACVLAVAPARAQSLTFFFNTAFLDPLAQSPLLLNLTAQSSRRIAQADVNAFDDFFLINGPGRL